MKRIIMIIGFVLIASTASAASGSFKFKTVNITWDAPAPASAVIANIENRSGKTLEYHMEVALSHMFEVLKRNYAGSKSQFKNLSQARKDRAIANDLKYESLGEDDKVAIDAILNK